MNFYFMKLNFYIYYCKRAYLVFVSLQHFEHEKCNPLTLTTIPKLILIRQIFRQCVFFVVPSAVRKVWKKVTVIWSEKKCKILFKFQIKDVKNGLHWEFDSPIFYLKRNYFSGLNVIYILTANLKHCLIIRVK